MRFFSWWRRPARPAEPRAYLNPTFAASAFTDAAVANAPAQPGVFLLYRSGELVYIGMAASIRAELAVHRRGGYGACTHQATAFDYEVSLQPARVQRAYLREHMARHGGRLPPCNEKDEGK